MNVEERYAKVKELMSKREAVNADIDAQIASLFGADKGERAQRECSHCHKLGHTARKCPDKLKATA